MYIFIQNLGPGERMSFSSIVNSLSFQVHGYAAIPASAQQHAVATPLELHAVLEALPGMHIRVCIYIQIYIYIYVIYLCISTHMYMYLCIYIYISISMCKSLRSPANLTHQGNFYLREFVLTTVIMVPGTCRAQGRSRPG